MKNIMMTEMATKRCEHLQCYKCGRRPEEIPEVAEVAFFEGMTPDNYIIAADGTYTSTTNRFACDACWEQGGMPAYDLSDPRGNWTPDSIC